LVAVTAAVLAFGGFGLLLAVLGIYHLLPVVIVGTVATLGITAIAWPGHRSAARSRRMVTLPAVGMCILALGLAVWNGREAGHHVAIGRDPGVYAVTGKWIAVHGNLEVRTGTEWSTKSPGLTVVSLGTYAKGNDQLQFQFDHLTPVLFAEADNLGGDGLMFRVTALLGALALCAVYAVGCRLVRQPWLVLAAVGALGVSLPQLNVSRDTYSEPAVELLLWSGMWLALVAYRRRHLGMALLAGMALVGTTMSRIDAPVYLIPLPLLAALTWLAAKSAADRKFLARMCGAFLLGAAPVGVLGTIDIQDRAGHYYDDLHSEVHQLQLGLAASIVVAVGLVALWPLVRPTLRGLTDWARARRAGIATTAGCIVAFGLLLAWAIRPAVMHPLSTSTPLIGGLQDEAGLPFQPARSYAEDSVIWISWYLGPITVALAAVGAAVAVARSLRQAVAEYSLVLAVAGIGTALYLWKPSIAPDQIWAMRRFVPAAFPLFVLLAALALAAIADAVATRASSIPAVPILATGAAAMLAFPIGTTLPVRDFRPQAGFLAAVDATCRATGNHAAIVTALRDQDEEELVPALRSWCDVPVATMTRPFSAQQLRHLADEWQASGRTLWILGSTPTFITGSAPGLTPVLLTRGISSHELEMTIDRPPSRYVVGTLSIYASRVVP